MNGFVCTFFGNRNATKDIMPQLYDNIEQIIKTDVEFFMLEITVILTQWYQKLCNS
ncbi:MAG: hypothetical protein IJN93_04495 [Clostridia bacterium]|nr:hypothetical protein [Clostridia bacterium]